MKYTPNAMKSGTHSKSSSLTLNMTFGNCESWPEIKNFGRFSLKIAMCSNFYEIWHLEQIEHVSYEYNIHHCLVFAWLLAQNDYRL